MSTALPAIPSPDFPHPPRVALDALVVLQRLDPDFSRIVDAAGPLPWRRRAPGFSALLHAIVAQMISNQAAAAIWGRALVLPGVLEPETFLLVSEDDLRAAGFSRPKVRHARALAEAFLDGRLHPERLAGLEDEAAIEAIASVKGMGRWSAEVYLLFALERLDVFPSGDIALAAALADLKGMPTRLAAPALREYAMRWQPVRSMAARLLWHHWRHMTGRPSFDELQVV